MVSREIKNRIKNLIFDDKISKTKIRSFLTREKTKSVSERVNIVRDHKKRHETRRMKKKNDFNETLMEKIDCLCFF